MARMHSRRKGRSGSHKPVLKTKPTWVRYRTKEIEALVVKLAKEGKTPSQIGLLLRDVYGIPDVHLITQKNITKIIKEHDLLKLVPEMLSALIRKSIMVRKHLEENKQDKTAKRGLQLTESKISRLIKYYKASGRLPKDWKYDPKKASLYLE